MAEINQGKGDSCIEVGAILIGPFGVVRHPLYVLYFLITVGLAGVLHIGWILIPSLCIAFGIYPTAKAEEKC